MHLGHGSTPQQKPRKAFDQAKQANRKKIDFGESSLSNDGVYRTKWASSSSLFWKILQGLFILFLIVTLFSIAAHIFFK
jgi:hypothetical protein